MTTANSLVGRIARIVHGSLSWALLAAIAVALPAGSAAAGELTFEQRVAAQKAIELQASGLEGRDASGGSAPAPPGVAASVAESPGEPTHAPVSILGGAEEPCDGRDNDGDGTIDEGGDLVCDSPEKAGSDVRVTNNASNSQYPSLIWTGSEYGVSWQDDRDGNFEIYFAPISCCDDADGDGFNECHDCNDGNSHCTTNCTDADGDGWCVGFDCNDANPRCGSCTDGDGDGWCAEFDCNDANSSINPNALETRNGIDDNCNGEIDEGLAPQSASWRLSDQVFNEGGHPLDETVLTSPTWKVKLDAIGDTAESTSLTAASFHADGGFGSTYGPPGEVVGLAFPNKTALTWQPEKSVGVYNLYRDPLSMLPGRGYGTCYQQNYTTESASDPGTPPLGSGWFYLVTAENRLGEEGTKGKDKAGVERPNPQPCP